MTKFFSIVFPSYDCLTEIRSDATHGQVLRRIRLYRIERTMRAVVRMAAHLELLARAGVSEASSIVERGFVAAHILHAPLVFRPRGAGARPGGSFGLGALHQ